MSHRLLPRSKFLRQIEAVTKFLNFDRRRLCYEINESVLADFPVDSAKLVNGLHALGVRVAVDDFGSTQGHSTDIGALPIDAMKIDLSHLIDAHNDTLNVAMIDRVIDYARRHSIQLIVKHVEHAEQVNQLRAVGISYLQGRACGTTVSAGDALVWADDGQDSPDSQVA